MSTGTRDQRRAEARAQREAAEQAAAASQQRRKRLLQLGGVLLAALAIIAVVVVATGGSDTKTADNAPQSGEAVASSGAIAEQLGGIPQKGITLGKANAPVTVVEFADLQCPVCAAYSNTEMPKIVQDYVRPGTAKIELRTLTFLGEDSVRLGRMAQAAAQQDRMFDFTELVYANHGQENTGYATDEYLQRIGGAIDGFDVAAAMQARDGAQIDQRLADADRLASINGVQGTPTFLVGPTGGTLKMVDASQVGAEIERVAAQQS